MRYATIALWLLMAAIPSAAQIEQRQPKTQSKPDLSGTWVLDQRQSYPPSNRIRVSGTLSVTQHDSEIRMAERLTLDGQDSAREAVLYTDGRKNVYNGHTSDNARTEWKARTLVTTSKRAYTSMRYIKHYEETINEWKLSKDGKTLTMRVLTMVWPNDFDNSWSKRVYTRMP